MDNAHFSLKIQQQMNIKIKIVFVLGLVLPSLGFYSKNYRKCTLFGPKTDVGSLKIERVPEYHPGFRFAQQTTTRSPLNITPLQFIYDEYVDAGGSGQVYRVEDMHTGEIRILKRYFKQNQMAFEEENHIMNEMGYTMGWHKEDNNQNKSTMASYPSKQSIVLRDLEVEAENEVATVFYKICVQIGKAHRRGLIHDDIKMGNILIHSVGEGLRTINVQLIDWNLATFYYRGYDSDEKKGTPCYYSPEYLIRTIDIWSLAVVYFTFVNEKKPFPISCKDNNFEAMLSLVGSERYLEVLHKYNLGYGTESELIKSIKENYDFYPAVSIRDRLLPQHEQIFSPELIDLLEKMLEVDPEYRLTITQILNHPYFDRIKRLPKMYQEKNKKKFGEKKAPSRHAPANNLVTPGSNQEANQ